jgi:hypothetical protein
MSPKSDSPQLVAFGSQSSVLTFAQNFIEGPKNYCGIVLIFVDVKMLH